MFTVKNLRKESKDGWTYLKTDFEVTEIESPFEEKTMWIAVEDKNADMLTDDVYDAFLLVPLYLGMYYHQDVHIEGEISPRFYHNITHYLMTIFYNFSDYTKKVKFIVDGFKVAQKGPIDLIGTGISCGVDSLTTIYDNFIKTTDENFRINSLFLTNCGTHGDYRDNETREIWLNRAKLNKGAADELGLPMYLIDSNLHAYTHPIDKFNTKIGYLSIYSCIIALQKYIKRYLTSSGMSYDEILISGEKEKDKDMADYAESYMPHLISTEGFELVIDGCQYTRAEKVEKISDWDIAQKYLNVCVMPLKDGKNCSWCVKCTRTLIALEAMGKLDNFKNVFNLQTYHEKENLVKHYFVNEYDKDIMMKAIIDYAREHNLKMPNKQFIHITFFIVRAKNKIKRTINKVLNGKKND